MLKKIALSYQQMGWSIFPIDWKESRAKKPLVKWEPYQSKRATEKEIELWFKRWPKANIGLVTGELSGILVVDIESATGREAYKAEFGEIHNTIAQKTGKEKGIHLIFEHPRDGYRYLNHTKIRVDIDTRGDGGYICLAPSTHPESGKNYEWIIDPVEMGLDDLLPLPEAIRPLFTPEKIGAEKEKPDGLSAERKNEEGWVQEAIMGTEKGQRNHMCAKLAGYYLRRFQGDPDQTKMMLEMWNQRNVPPLDWKEVEKTVQSIAGRQGTEELSQEIGEDIQKIEVLCYPDGSKKYNVYLENCAGYAQMTLKQLGYFTEFKWQFGDLAGYIPRNISQPNWEIKINKALSEAIRIDIQEEETVLGVIASSINSDVFGKTRTVDEKFIDNRIIVVGANSKRIITMKMKTIIEMVKFENERLGRKEMGEYLRKLGFVNDPPQKINQRQIRIWYIDYEQWRQRYMIEYQGSVAEKQDNESDDD